MRFKIFLEASEWDHEMPFRVVIPSEDSNLLDNMHSSLPEDIKSASTIREVPNAYHSDTVNALIIYLPDQKSASDVIQSLPPNMRETARIESNH